MNFLKSVLSSSGGFPGYTIQDKVDVPANCLYTLNNAVFRETNAPCSVLTFEVSKAQTLLPLAKNYLLKLRSLKHPGVVKFLDSHETDGYIYIATERISPLSHTLSKEPNREVLCWGLYSVAATLAFINTEATSTHGNIRSTSIFTTESGEWKVAGLEALTCMKDDDPFILRYGSLVPEIHHITPPELQTKGFADLRNLSLTSLDSWQFACLVWVCFNGPYSSPTSLSGQGKIPNNMFAQYRRLLSPTPNSRLPISNFLDFGRRPGGFFRTDLIEISEAIPSLPLKSKAEVEVFLEENMKLIATLPSGFTKNKLLPELIKSFEFGGGGSTALTAILTVAKDLAPSDVEVLITPMLLRIWTSKDRAVHLVLLENLKDYLDYMTDKQLNDKLFPGLGAAFTDPAPIMRETAIRQVMILAPRLTDRNLNGDLLKYLAKTANDQQPGIRTNTTICLGKISSYLGASNGRKVLTAAFSRSLKDPFVHARMASLQAINATAEVYDKEDLANRLVPGVVALLIDAERTVREQARKTLGNLLTRIEHLTKDMPETLAINPGTAQGATAAVESAATGAIEGAGIWAGWAVSTLSRNIDSSSPVQTTPNTTTNGTVSLPVTRAATPVGGIRRSTPGPVESKPARERPAFGARAGSGLKLTAAKSKKVDVSSIYADDFGTGEDAWGTEDWDEGPVRQTNGLAKPLAKSTAGVIKKTTTLAESSSSVEKKKRPSREPVHAEEATTEDWDTDAW